MARPPILILGASARAAAFSAARAGFAPITLDLFADVDLALRFPSHRIDPTAYPQGLFEIANRLPEAPWIYTGALENHPMLIDELAGRRRLLGISGEGLRSARDPAQWTGVLNVAGFATAEVRVFGDDPPESGDWLLKRLKSAAGFGIQNAVGIVAIPSGYYAQERIKGPSVGATFLGDGRSARLAGVTSQLLGQNEAGLRVAYQGSLGPLPIEPGLRRAIERVGDVLATAFAWRGVFGIDLVLSRRGPIVVEVNPRYTASLEVLEEALGVSLLAAHARAFGVDLPEQPTTAQPINCVAKQILFATNAMRVPESIPPELRLDGWPEIADIPAVGTVFAAGEPVMTVFGRGKTHNAAVAELVGRTRVWRGRFDRWTSAFETTQGEPKPAPHESMESRVITDGS